MPSTARRRRRPGHRTPARAAACAALLAAALCALPGSAGAQPTVRVGVLKFGTVHWELDVMREHGLAAAHGIALEVLSLASTRATAVALQGGAVDVIVSDWIWVSRQRAEDRRHAFVPWSLAVGGLMVRPDSGIASLADLRGRKVGVAGGPVDKSWLLMRAYARQRLGADLAEIASPSFAAPPLLNQLMLRGDLPAVLNFWHYNARLEAAGMRELLGVADVLPALGIDAPVPLLGWVFSEQWARDNRERLHAFLDASYAAKHLLLASDAEWQRLQPLLGADDPATVAALRDAYRRGVPDGFGDAERAAAAKAFAVLAREGGSELVGASATLDPGTFWPDYTVPRWPR